MVSFNSRLARRVWVPLVLTITLFALSPTNATAVPTTYTYTGNFFDTIFNNTPPTGTYTTGNRVTGSFTTATLLGFNIPATLITPSTFSYSDGRSTITSTTIGAQGFFQISTDGTEQISQWNISVTLPFTSPLFVGQQGFTINTQNNGAGVKDQGLFSEITSVSESGGVGTSDQGRIADAPGVWIATSEAAVPEPTTLLLLGFGLAGLGFMRRRASG